MNATSGDSSFSERIRSASASIGMTSWPSDARASSTLAADRSETWRSSELPPFSTATRTGRLVLPAGWSEWNDVAGRRLGGVRVRQAVLRGDRFVQLHLLAHHRADAADALADLVLGGAGEVQAHRIGALAPVDIRGSAGDERDVLPKRLRQQIGGVDVVGQRRPHEQAAARPRPGRLPGEMTLQRLEHRVATRPVDLAQAVDIRPPAPLAEVLEGEVLGEGRGAEVGRLLAEGDLLHHRRWRHGPPDADPGGEDLGERADVDDVVAAVELVERRK